MPLVLGQSCASFQILVTKFGDGGYLPIKFPYNTVEATIGLQDSLGVPGICCGSTGHV